jgi:hypothetical protein
VQLERGPGRPRRHRRNLRHQDPDLLFFAGDQSYDHKQHLEAWLLFGRQFRDIMRDRPTITIPDDHDIGQGNLWGAGGIKADNANGDSGGYFFSPDYVRAVEAAQTWHLPDPYDPTPIARGIGVYYTDLTVGRRQLRDHRGPQVQDGPAWAVPAQGGPFGSLQQPEVRPASRSMSPRPACWATASSRSSRLGGRLGRALR